MLERLEVHGKVYEPLSVVAEDVSYTEAELTRFVEEKIVPAAMIDAQWFVDRAAVVALQHTHPSDVEKRAQAARKVARAATIKTVYATSKTEPPATPMTTTLQAGAVVACGLLVGSLLYWSGQADVDVVALQAGVIGASDAFVEGLEPVWSTWQDVLKIGWYE